MPHRLALVVALWATATAFGLAIGALTKVGPVVLTLSRSHGVHVGDLIALTAAYAEASVLTRRVLRRV